jgi:hypothetical protein
MFVNVLQLYGGKMCTQLWGINKVFTLGVSLMFQYPKLGLLNSDGN